jgi:putative aldouronate transport system substrate-binding protein
MLNFNGGVVMKRKFLAVILSVCMLATVITGCKSNDSSSASNDNDTEAAGSQSAEVTTAASEETYHAVLAYVVPAEQKDMGLVQDAINAITVPEINVEVELLPFTWSTFFTQLPLMLAGGEQIDLLPILSANVPTFVDSGYIVDLKDLLQGNAPYLTEQYSEQDLDTCTLNGFLYGIPTKSESAFPLGFIMRTDCLQEAGIDPSTIKTYDDVTKVYEKVQALHPEMTMLAETPTSNLGYVGLFGSLGDSLGTRYAYLEGYAQSSDVVNVYETEEFKKMCEISREWFQAGYINADAATAQDGTETIMRAGNTFSYAGVTKPNSKQEKDQMTGYDTTVIPLYDNLITSDGMNGCVYSVGASSNNPAKAVQLLNLISSSEELNDLLNWGIKGTHWELQEDGTINYPEGVTADNVGYHCNLGSVYPNQFNSHVWAGNALDVFDQYEAVRDTGTTSVAYGFTADLREYADVVSAMDSITDEYRPQLATGSVDVEPTLTEFNQKLYDAGLQDVLNAVQEQLDAWLAAKSN